MLFTNESWICLLPDDGHLCVWHPLDHLVDDGVREEIPFGRESVIVWGEVSINLRIPLQHMSGRLTGQCYRDEILQVSVVPTLEQIGAQAEFCVSKQWYGSHMSAT